jgi:putative transposase
MIPADERRKMICAGENLPVSEQCELLTMPRSTFYYKPTGHDPECLRIMRIMDEMYLEDPTRGTRRYMSDLALKGIHIGRDKARSLMRLMGIAAIYPKPRTTVIDPAKYKYPYLLKGLKIERSNQVWQIDISYIPMATGFMYLFAVIDVYSRYIIGWSISNSMDAAWVVSTLKDVMRIYGKPEIINSDQGCQFTSDEYISFIKSQESIKISMDGKGRATDNVYIERFFRTIKYDKIYLEPPVDGMHLYTMCEEFSHFYNNKRSHSSIGKVPPAAVYRSAA